MLIDPPAVETEVTLTLPDREMLPGRIDVSAEDALDVAVLASPRTPLAVLEASLLYVEYVTDAGIGRMTGTIKALRSAPRHTDQYGVYDVVRFTSIAPPLLLQRREFIRAPYAAAVTVVVRGAEVACQTVNVSGGGLLVSGLEGVAVGDHVDVRLVPLDGGELPIHAGAEVVRRKPGGNVRLVFRRIDAADRDRLVDFAYACRLAERARRLAA
jgi:hypothetical protein